MYNTITTAGYLVSDPEVRSFNDNTVCQIRMCISNDRAKEKCFIDVELWGKQADIAKQYLTKGRSILLTGELKFSSWEHDGKKYSKNFIRGNEFTFLASGKKDDEDSNSNSSSESKPQMAEAEIPF
jgi:single-strand DNA-binding protein